MPDQPDPLPPFSGDDPTCPQCGYQGARTDYMAHGRCLHHTGVVLGVDPNPRLHRECERCDFEWDEATVADNPDHWTLTRVLDTELEYLWSTLHTAKERALNGAWSIECESIAGRIEAITRVIGPLPWPRVQMPLLLEGTYERLHRQWGIEHGPVDHAQVRATWDAYEARNRETLARLRG